MKCSIEDFNLYKIFREKHDKIPHDELYYAILEWANSHQEIKDEYARSLDEFVVTWIDKKSSKFNEKTFMNSEYKNPYNSAKKFYEEIYNDCESIQFWVKNNPYTNTEAHMINYKNIWRRKI